jgi:hypothetical protein
LVLGVMRVENTLGGEMAGHHSLIHRVH